MSLAAHYKFSIFKSTLLGSLLLLSSIAMAQAPTANFAATPLAGCAPLAVSFQDLSTGSNLSYQWDLGNGTQSTQASPTTVYVNPGQYTVTLTVSNANGSNTLTRTQYITVSDKPSVAFRVSDSAGCFPLRANFTDMSNAVSGTITSWEWDFGDGTGSTLQNPSHTYVASANYSVTLKVTNSAGCVRVLSKPAYIRVSGGVVVNFSNSTPVLCRPPETINFTNLSTGPGTLSHEWLFGDGNTSTATNPSNTYNSGGSFTVTLITTSSLGCTDTLVRPNAITIKNVTSDFSGPTSVCLNSPANFTNTSAPVPAGQTWDFGDATSSTLANPSKTWNAVGTYNVQLVNNYGTCTDTITKPVQVLGLPTPNFTCADSIDCKAPFTVNFQDLSAGGVSWQWSFGDGGSSNLQNPSHTYTANGTYTVKLVVTNANGCKDSLIKTQYIKILKPIVNIGGLPEEGCVPYTINPTAVVTAIDGVATYLWDFGEPPSSNIATPSHTYATQGTYTVKLFITTIDGCTDSAVIVDAVRVGTLPTVDFTASPLSQCVGQPIQFTDLSAPVDRWLWDFGNGNSATTQNPLYTYPDTGVYTIRLIAWNNGCPDTMTKTNYITALPPVARFNTSFTCNNKRQVLFTDNSILPQTWSWNFGDGNTSNLPNPSHTYAAYGSYNVSLTVTNGSCSNTITQTVTLINEIADFGVVKDTVCKREQVVCVVAPGVNQANIANYFWDFGDGFTLSGSNLTLGANLYANAGVYTVKLVLTDIRGCLDSVVKVNRITVYGPTSNFTAAPLSGCKGTTVNFTNTSVTDGLHPITNWLWYYGDGQMQSQNTGVPVSHSYGAAGNFIPKLKVTDSYGCTDSVATTLPIFITDPKAGFNTLDTLTCIGKNVNFTNSTAGLALQYAWTFGDGGSSNAVSPVHSYAADGDYTVKLVVTDTLGCKDSLQRTAYVKVRTTRSSFTVNDSISSCSPFEVQFTHTATNWVTMLWVFGDGTATTNYTPTHYYTIPGTYTAKLYTTGPGGCMDSSFKNITLYPSTATLTYTPLAGCAPLPVNFRVSTPGPVTYLWDFSDGNTLATTDSVLTYNYQLPGDFVPKVVLEDQTGCLIPVTGIDTIKVTRSLIKFGVNDSVFCDRGTVNFSDSTISNGTIISYQWSFGDGGTAVIPSPSHTYTAPGLYTVRIIVRTANGCADTLTKTNFIKVVATPQAAIIGDTSLCVPATIAYTGALLVPDTSVLSWIWNFGNGNTGSSATPAVQTYTTVGSFPLQLIVTNSTGCSDTVNRTVNIRPLPTTNAGNDTTLCLATPLQLQATGADSYTWSPGGYLSCTNCDNPFTSTPVQQWYYVTGTSIYGCTTVDSVLVKVKRPFAFGATPVADSICKGETVNLRSFPAENYTWSPPLGLSSTTIGNPIAKPDTTTLYKVVGYDSANCFKDSAYISIRVFEYPTVELGADRIISAGSSTTLTPVYSPDVVQWLWSPTAGLDCTACPEPVAKPNSTTTYSVLVINNGGCRATDKITIIVTCGDQNVFIPNTFTPNLDGVNDRFYPMGRGLYKVQRMQIFSRWGETVFLNTGFVANAPNEGWDGTFKGKPLPMDSYTYIIEVICNNSEVIPFKGNITLLR